MNNPTIIFLHIPKAAGTTLHAIIERQYPAEVICTIDGARVRQSIEEFKQLPISRRAELHVLKGHMSFGLHRWLPQPSTYITFLRNPVSRIVSHYHYVLRHPTHYLHEKVVKEGMSLEEYALSDLAPELNSGQVRVLSGDESVDTLSGSAPCGPEILAKAKENLIEHFSIVGIAEHFDESLILMKRLFGWTNVLYSKRNVSEIRAVQAQLSLATIRQIEERNALDMELYQFACRLFDDQLRQRDLGLKIETEAFRLFNRIGNTAHVPLRSWVKTRTLHKDSDRSVIR